MRDPARIDRVLAQIAVLWHRYPDLRLGQLLVNAEPRFDVLPFYIEDTDLEAALATWGQEHP